MSQIKNIYVIVLFLVISLFWGVASAADQERSYVLATASAGGTYYPVGVALATLTKVKLEPQYGLSVSAITSAGSGANIKLLRDKEAQFAILQGLYGAWAATGTGEMQGSGKQKYLRSITMLWQNVEHFVIDNKYRKTGTMEDLKELYGQGFGIGKRNSGTEGSGSHILEKLGIDLSKFTLVHKNYTATSEALQNGQVAAMNVPAGPPVSAVTSAYAQLTGKISLLGFTEEQLRKINDGLELWSSYTIPASTYPGQELAVQTIAQPNFLAVHENVSEEDVYLLTKTIYENLGFLHSIHKATKAMSLENSIRGLPVPLHPGAIKFYREKGISIPKRMIAN